MANLFFPQLSTGALAQYPIRKNRLLRTIKNVLGDGSEILLADPSASRLIWRLGYTELSQADTALLQAFFASCLGPYHAFTFIDPTDNMLVSSVDLTNAVWSRSGVIKIDASYADPFGGIGAFRVTNTGQTNQVLSQTLAIPSGYHYCFSAYVSSAQASTVGLLRQGASAQATSSVTVGSAWSRVVSSGTLTDAGTSFTVGINLAAGQQAQIFGIQLEAQVAPSRYRSTSQVGGVYPVAHWVDQELPIIAQGPDQFATSFSIETAI